MRITTIAPEKFDFFPDDICPKTGKRHKPDYSTVAVEYDGDAYIDVNCKHCGRSGCIGRLEVLEKEIQW